MAAQHHDEPDVPGLPQIHDEAADTPMWLPATGLGLLVLLVLMLVYRVAQGPEATTDAAAENAAGAEVVADEAAAEPAPAEPPAEAPAAAAPARDPHRPHGGGH
jgi:hypothetical protein